MHLKESVWAIIDEFMELILPFNQCLWCGGSIPAWELLQGDALCLSCRRELAEYTCCPDCAVFLPEIPDDSLRSLHQTYCHTLAPFGIGAVCAFAPYYGQMRENILQLKYHEQRRLAKPLGREMARTWRQTGWQADVIIPVPLHESKRRQRGYNQCDLLAKACGSILEMPVLTEVLLRIRETAVQNNLNAAERQKNVAQAFACGSGAEQLTGQRIILLDDIITTGSTLKACAAALQPYEPAAIYGLAACGKLLLLDEKNDKK